MPKLVFVHGWGLNSAVWSPLLKSMSRNFECICLDLPGYGSRTGEKSPDNLDQLAEDLLHKAPESAHWCAWSLGGMAAMSAAIKKPMHFKSLSLLCTTPKFVQSDDWHIGMDMSTFKNFTDELEADYQTGIQKFLLLQAGAGAQAKSLANEASALLSEYPIPSSQTLSSGLEILNQADLRTQLFSMNVPSQVISGKRDRIVHPKAGEELSKILPEANYQLLNSGHAPHLSCPEALDSLLTNYIGSLEEVSESKCEA